MRSPNDMRFARFFSLTLITLVYVVPCSRVIGDQSQIKQDRLSQADDQAKDTEVIRRSTSSVAVSGSKEPPPAVATKEQLGTFRPLTNDDKKTIESHKELHKDAIQNAQYNAVQQIADRYIANLMESGRIEWLSVLVELPLAGDQAQRIFTPLIRHENLEVQSQAAFLYARHFPDSAQNELGIFVAMLDSKHNWVIQRSAEAIAALGLRASGAMPALTLGLQLHNDSESVQLALIHAIACVSHDLTPSQDVLVAKTRSSNVAIAVAAFRTIHQLGDVRVALPSDMSQDLQNTIHASLPIPTMPDIDTDIVRNHLLKSLGHNLPLHIRIYLIERLAGLRPSDQTSVSHIFALIANDNPYASETGIRASIQLADPTVETVHVVAPYLSGSNDQVAKVACDYLIRRPELALHYQDNVIQCLSIAIQNGAYERMGTCLDLIRYAKLDTTEVRSLLITMMPSDSPAYKGLNQHQAKILRQYVLVTVAAIGTPSEAIPIIVDNLVNTSDPSMIGAGCRAAGALSTEHISSEIIRFVSRPLEDDFADSVFSLVRFDQAADPRHPDNNTTARIECIRAVSAMGPDVVRAVEPQLRRRAQDVDSTSRTVTIRYQKLAQEVLNVLPD